MMHTLRQFSEKINGMAVVFLFGVTYLMIVPFFKVIDVARELFSSRKTKPQQTLWYKKDTKAYDRDFFDSMG